jgi:DNA-binding NtrC family response regulator
MIIDDDADLGNLLVGILEERKIHALAVNSLSEAEECLGFMKPSVIFLDNNFPEGLGINFIKSIKSVDEHIKIIMITGETSEWIREKAIAEGINGFLYKPFDRRLIDYILDKMRNSPA